MVDVQHYGGPADPGIAPSLDPAEAAKFARMAESWWDPHGDFRPLHKLNPTRIGYIRDQAAAWFGRDPLRPQPLGGLRVLDIGCGGGLVAEPLTRLGAQVTGIDPVPGNVAAARTHAAQAGLSIDYVATTVEDLTAFGGPPFDVVLALEVVEHVRDPRGFVATCAGLLAPGGLMIVSTINRTAKAFALAIVGAEYVLRWLPRGTHDWRRFVRPSELAGTLRAAGLDLVRLDGMTYDVLRDEWRIGRDLDVNYFAVAARRSMLSG